jgi:hypothetical protein
MRVLGGFRLFTKMPLLTNSHKRHWHHNIPARHIAPDPVLASRTADHLVWGSRLSPVVVDPGLGRKVEHRDYNVEDNMFPVVLHCHSHYHCRYRYRCHCYCHCHWPDVGVDYHSILRPVLALGWLLSMLTSQERNTLRPDYRC